MTTEEVVLGSFERKIVRAQVVTQQKDEYHFRNVMIHPCGMYAKCPFASEDTLTSVGEDGTVFLAVRNKTVAEHVTVKTKTVIGKAELTTFALQPIVTETNVGATALPLSRSIEFKLL